MSYGISRDGNSNNNSYNIASYNVDAATTMVIDVIAATAAAATVLVDAIVFVAFQSFIIIVFET